MRRGAGVAGAVEAGAGAAATGAAGAAGGATATAGRTGAAFEIGRAITGPGLAGGRGVRGGATVTGRAAGGVATATGRCACGGALRAAFSAFLRSRMARMASPGLEMLPRLKAGSALGADLAWLERELGFLKYSRTRSAWSSSMELEWV